MMHRSGWRFAIDVGGTFTDCVGISPEGQLRVFKTLSSGRTKGVVHDVRSCSFSSDFERTHADAVLHDTEQYHTERQVIVDPARCLDPPGFWVGARIEFLPSRDFPSSSNTREYRVTAHDSENGTLLLDSPIHESVKPGTSYELISDYEAPILGIRHLLGIAPHQPIPHCEVRLGTTRGTNALLERRGARVGFVATTGFADLLLIGDQARPHLFELAIRKPVPLTHAVVEIEERLAADGSVLRAPDPGHVRSQLTQLRDRGCESVAVALLHAYRNPVHELLVGKLAIELGFKEVVLSHQVSPTIKIVPRAESTVLDAYLNPILREYVERISSALSENSTGALSAGSWESRGFDSPSAKSLLLMTSSGGLVSKGEFSGKVSVLSGPAGGAVGFSSTSTRAGFPKAIGFDMGGTSTDVSRFDGRFELETESRKAGVRISAPTLAIETVAAGGGSICGFDGVKLTVGPASSGAEPGPACYGRGGPLTITDCNLLLGRIIADRFPFPLDRTAAEDRARELARRVADGIGTHLSPEELAEGLIAIANSHMARAIRRISVARGYDPREYALSVFGGAGAQHACELARNLEMPTVLVHPLASVLSAYGIACAPRTSHATKTILRPLVEYDRCKLDGLFEELVHELVKSFEHSSPIQGSVESTSAQEVLEYSLDLRYSGIESTITVTTPPGTTWTAADFAAAYETAHEREFGFRRTGRAIEIAVARVQMQLKSNDDFEACVRSQLVRSSQQQRVRLAGQWCEVPVYHRSDAVGVETPLTTEITGPALINESLTTLFVDEGCSARISPDGSILMTVPTKRCRTEEANSVRTASLRLVSDTIRTHPIQLEIFNNLFASIAEQMGETLRRTSVSTNVKERLDYSCALFDAAGELIVNAPHIPVHLGAMGETVKRVLADNSDLSPGDVVLTNDPYRGGSHLPDLTVVTPVYGENRQLRFVVASRAHHAELGGIVPGSMPPFSRTLADEGVQIRNLRIVRQGVFQEDDLRKLLMAGPYPSRRPDDNIADVTAQIAANQTGVEQLGQLVSSHSLEIVQHYMRAIREAAASKVRSALSAMPNGEYRNTDYLDDGTPISVTVSIHGDSATVDFAGTGPVLATNLNANRAIVTAAVLYVFRTMLNEEIPLNGGVLQPVSINLPECLLNPPAFDDPSRCAAIVGGNVETSQRVVDVLLGALRLAAASQGTMNNLTFGDSTFGYYETICGGSGAAPRSDGADAVQVHMTNTRLTDVELMEHRYPVRVRRFAIRRGSGGAGRHRGGDGIIRELEFLRPVTASILSQRRGPYPPPGLEGGQPGELGRNSLIRANGTSQDLGAAAQVAAHAGDIIRIETPGGGGYGISHEKN